MRSVYIYQRARGTLVFSDTYSGPGNAQYKFIMIVYVTQGPTTAASLAQLNDGQVKLNDFVQGIYDVMGGK